MNLPAPSTRCLAAALLALACSGTPAPGVWAESPPPAALTVPAAPALPKSLAFADEAEGRRLYFACRRAMRDATALAYTVKVMSGDGATATSNLRLTETVKAQPSLRRVSITTEETSRVVRSIRRAISDGSTVIATRFLERTAPREGEGPTRAATELAAIEGVPLGRLFVAVDAFPSTLGSQFLLNLAAIPRGATLWREGAAAKDTLLLTDPPGGAGESRRTRRLTLDPISHRLVRFEEWTVSSREARPARRGPDSAPRVTYRREDYAYSRPPANGFPAADFSTRIPANYGVANVPANRIPEPTADPAATEPKALALLERWRDAQEGYLSFAATVEQTMTMTPRSATSRPIPPERANTAVRYEVQTRRPGKARVTAETLQGGGNWGMPRSALFVSDGTRLLATDRDSNRSRSYPLNQPEQLWGSLARAGLRDGSGGGITWVFAGPPDLDDWDKVSYEGRGDVNGEAVEIVRLERLERGRRRRAGTVENAMVTRVALATADGLPRRIESESSATIENGVAFDRDQPPVVRASTVFRNVRINREPLPETFVVR